MHLSLKAITLIPKSLIKYKDPDSVRPIKAELLSDSDRGVQTKRTLMTERQKVTGRSMQENFVGSLGLNGNSRMGSAYVRASGSCAGEWKEQVEGLAEEDSRERGWAWVYMHQGKSESRHRARRCRNLVYCCRNLVHGCTGHEDGSSQPALCSWWARWAARGRVPDSIRLCLGLGRHAWHFCQRCLWK